MNSKQLKAVKDDFLNGQVIDFLEGCHIADIKLDSYRGRVIGLDVESQKGYIDWVEHMYKEYGFTPKQTSDMVICVMKEAKNEAYLEKLRQSDKEIENGEVVKFEKILEDVLEAELNTVMGCIAWNKFFGGGI